MKKSKTPATKKNKGTLFWLPRILTLIFIAFISMFALDVFGMGLGFFGTLGALIAHLIPTMILSIILIICWRKSLLLGIMWIIFGFWYISLMIPNMIQSFEYYHLAWIIEFSGMAFVIAILFFCDLRKK